MKCFFFTIPLLFCLQSYCQLPDYYVYLVKGNSTITKQKSASMVIKQKMLVYKTDFIFLAKDAEVTLVDKDANFLTISTPGNYKSSEIYKIATKKKTEGITSKYLKLLYHELLDPDHDYEKFKNENIAGVWGGVTRSDECNNRVFPLNGVKASCPNLLFRWHKSSPASSYKFYVFSAEGKEVTMKALNDTSFNLVINKTLPSPGKYFWIVSSEDGECEDEIPIYFEILDPETELDQVTKLLSNMDDQTLEQKLEQIDKLEKNGYTITASERYSALIRENPENEALRKSYVLFLLKHGLSNEAAIAWKTTN